MEILDKPLYKHDCDECVFLGNYKNKDLYFCKKTLKRDDVTLIIRNSDEPQDYFSMPSKETKILLSSRQLPENLGIDICYNRYIEYISK